MKTTHARAAHAAVDTLLQHPDGTSLLRATWEFLNCTVEGCRCAEYRRIFADPRSGEWPLEQLVALTTMGALIDQGLLYMRSFYVGQPPSNDRNRPQHQRVLQGLRVHGLEVQIDPWTGGGNGLADGSISWSEPLEVLALEGEHRLTVGPRSAVLETGSTEASRTLSHLLVDGALWRWPYDSERVWLLICAESDGAR